MREPGSLSAFGSPIGARTAPARWLRLVDPVLIEAGSGTFVSHLLLCGFQVSRELREKLQPCRNQPESTCTLTWLMCLSLSMIWLMTGSGALPPLDSGPGCNLFGPDLRGPDGNIESVFRGIWLNLGSSRRPPAPAQHHPACRLRHLVSTEGRTPELLPRSSVEFFPFDGKNYKRSKTEQHMWHWEETTDGKQMHKELNRLFVKDHLLCSLLIFIRNISQRHQCCTNI